MRPVRDGTWLRISRDRALVAQRGRCRYCKGRLTRRRATADHVQPRALGGSDHHGNIAAACEACNLAKGALEPRRFMRMVRGQIAPSTPAIALIAAFRRIENRTDRAVARILRFAGVPATEVPDARSGTRVLRDPTSPRREASLLTAGARKGAGLSPEVR